LSTEINRDVKGLFLKAINGEIKNFIGIAPKVPYRPPKYPALTLDIDKDTVDQSVQKMYHFLENGYLDK
jgi:adenylylsulfate kinase